MTDTPLPSAMPPAPTEARPSKKRQSRGNARPREAGKAPARPREVHPVLEKLFELYPKMFGAKFLPLKLGAFQDLLAQNPEVFKRDELKVARSTRYLESVAAGHPRHDLQGEPVEPVAPEHVHHAIMEVFRRRQARSREDLRPGVRARLMEAIEASGLGRAEYLEKVRAQDELTQALLDEAFAEMAVQHAKREALKRAFDASGKTVAQFAAMYGMDPAEVAATLERVRAALGTQKSTPGTQNPQ